MTYRTHGVKVEPEVMHRVQRSGEGFTRDEEMAQIRPAVSRADFASTPRIEGVRVLGKAQVLDVEPSFGSKQQSVASRASRQNTIHHVDTHRRILSDLV